MDHGTCQCLVFDRQCSWLTDLLFQPCLCIMYFLNYVDRNAIAQARLNNLEEDLNMSGTEFNTTVSMYVEPKYDF